MARRKQAEEDTITVYLLCFAHNPIRHAKHYLGSALARRLPARIHEHECGRGHALTHILHERGDDFIVSRLWPGNPNRSMEYRIKKWGGKSRICPMCNQRLADKLPDLSEYYEANA